MDIPGRAKRSHKIDELGPQEGPHPSSVHPPWLGEDRHGREKRTPRRRDQCARDARYHTPVERGRQWQVLAV